MPFIPRLASDILADLRGGVIGRTELSDISVSSSLHIILSSIAEEVANVERKLYSMREQFFLEGASGADLDERVSELPPFGIRRLSRANASGSVLFISRSTSTGNLLIPAGSTVKADNGVVYAITQDVVIPAGDTEIDNVAIICKTAGVIGNKGVGLINRIGSLPSEVNSVINTQPLTNGRDEESDEELRARAYLYLKSLGRTQPASLEFMAQTYTGSQGDRFTYARLFEDLANLGYSELCVDDGSGLNVQAVSRVGVQSTGKIPTSGANIMWHEAPATEPISPLSITIWKDGNENTQYGATAADFVSIPERGLIYFRDGVLEAGDVWFINNYRVFTGLIAELQKEVEGNTSDPSRLTGFRAAGTRVRVIPVRPQFVTMDVSLIVDTSFDFKLVENRCISTIGTFINSLAPNTPLYMSQVADACIGIPGLLDIRFYERDSETSKSNVYPLDPRTALRTNSNSVKITTSAR
jgi:hypothetical protein